MLGEGTARHGSVAVPGGECAQHVGGVCEVGGHQVQGSCGHEHECAVQDVLARGAPVDELRVLGHSFGHGCGEVGDEWDHWIAPACARRARDRASNRAAELVTAVTVSPAAWS